MNVVDEYSTLVEAGSSRNFFATITTVVAIERARRYVGSDPAFARVVIRLAEGGIVARGAGDRTSFIEAEVLKHWVCSVGSHASQVALLDRTLHGRLWELDCLSHDGRSTVVLGPVVE